MTNSFIRKSLANSCNRLVWSHCISFVIYGNQHPLTFYLICLLLIWNSFFYSLSHYLLLSVLHLNCSSLSICHTSLFQLLVWATVILDPWFKYIYCFIMTSSDGVRTSSVVGVFDLELLFKKFFWLWLKTLNCISSRINKLLVIFKA